MKPTDILARYYEIFGDISDNHETIGNSFEWRSNDERSGD
jgi:hypothetical protein